MVTEISKIPSPLLPDRHRQHELFICEIADAVLKDDMASMEHPIFSLSTKPDNTIRSYEHGDVELTVEPSARGMATIYDKDILIYAISKLMKAKAEGSPINRKVAFTAYDFLVFSNRMTNGNAYEGLKDAMSRLDGTRLRTTIKTGGEEQWTAFGLIDGARIRKSDKTGRVVEWGVTLSEWLFNAVDADEVLTLHRDYFRLRKPLERRVYEIARKHCGHQDSWRISLELLLKKSGSQSPEKRFRQMIRHLAEHDHLPDYSVSYDAEMDTVVFSNRGMVKSPALLESDKWDGPLDSEIFDRARKAAPGWDVHRLETEWRGWLTENDIIPRRPEANFLKFCTTWYAKRGNP